MSNDLIQQGQVLDLENIDGSQLPANIRAPEDDPMLNSLAGLDLSIPRITLGGNMFHLIVGGDEVATLPELVGVIVATSPIGRMYYEGDYTPGDSSPPVCWATDRTTGPDPDVLKRQAESCNTCPMAAKGPDGRSKCAFAVNLAVKLEGAGFDDTLFKLTVKSMSIFGSGPANSGQYKLQQLAKVCKQKRVYLSALRVKLVFDPNAGVPSVLLFQPIGMVSPTVGEDGTLWPEYRDQAPEIIKMDFAAIWNARLAKGNTAPQQAIPQQVAPQPAPQQAAPQPAPQQVAPQQVAPQPVPQQVAPQPVPQQVAPQPVPQQAAPQPAPQQADGFDVEDVMAKYHEMLGGGNE